MATQASTQQFFENYLKKIVPAKRLNDRLVSQLASKAKLFILPPKRILFREGKSDYKTFYLAKGSLILSRKGGEKKLIKAPSSIAEYPIDNHQPRRSTAITHEKCVIVRLDSEALGIVMAWDGVTKMQDGTKLAKTKKERTGKSLLKKVRRKDPERRTKVEDESEDTTETWMTRILESQAFMQIPPPNIQAMFMRLNEVKKHKGDTVIKQGDVGDYYYLIKRGRCEVTRNMEDGKEIKLAELGRGDHFGEEALLSDEPRNANIRMLTEGTLMRLGKKDFNELLREPMIHQVTMKEAQEMIESGEAVWLDVRLNEEYKANKLKGSINIPLFMIRLKIDALDPKYKYIIYCESGHRSSVATYLLKEKGFKAYCLRGGLNNMHQKASSARA